MNKYFVILFLVFGCNSFQQHQNENDYKKNNVTEEFVYDYDYKFGQVDSSTQRLSSHKVFDTSGACVYMVSYPDLNFYKTLEYSKPETTFTKADIQKTMDGWVTKEFESINNEETFRLRRERFVNYDGFIQKNTLYDILGNVTDMYVYEYDGKEIRTMVRYDSTGTVVEKTTYFKNGYKSYDADGKMISNVESSKAGDVETTYYKEDSTKKIIQQNDTIRDYKMVDGMGKETFRYLTRLKNGLAIEMTGYRNGEPYIYSKYKYEFRKY